MSGGHTDEWQIQVPAGTGISFQQRMITILQTKIIHMRQISEEDANQLLFVIRYYIWQSFEIYMYSSYGQNVSVQIMHNIVMFT